jgi:hypothetical protein
MQNNFKFQLKLDHCSKQNPGRPFEAHVTKNIQRQPGTILNICNKMDSLIMYHKYFYSAQRKQPSLICQGCT